MFNLISSSYFLLCFLVTSSLYFLKTSKAVPPLYPYDLSLLPTTPEEPMGCIGSKLQDLEPVALCKDRSILLESAIRHRYSLATAHLSYLRSLSSIGLSLQRFFENISHLSPPPPSPLPPLPNQLNSGSSDSHPQTHAVNLQSGSRSESCRHFQSDSDSESDSEISCPLHDHVHGEGTDRDKTLDPSHMNYMQSRPAVPSVVYQRQNTETVHVEEVPVFAGYAYPNPSSHSYPYPYSYSYSNPYSYPSNEYAYSSYGVGYGGYYGSSSSSPSSFPPQFDRFSYFPPGLIAAPDSTSSWQPPPSPPPPSPPLPQAAAWDFLNPFDAYERYYPAYTPSRDSEALREEEGIPDLEDDDYQPSEAVKKVEKEKKSVANGSGSGGGDLEKVADEADDKIVVEESEGVRFDVNLADEDENEIVVNEEDCHDWGDVAATKGGGRGELLEVAGVVREMKAQFDRASESGNEVSKLLEVGKLPYRGKNAVYKVSSKTLDVVSPPFSVGSAERNASLYFNFDEYMEVNSRNLSSTLGKLYVWEKKLYEEVKAEEKLRIIYDRKCRQLKRLDERGAEPHKLESTQTLVKKLSMKMRMAIQIVNSISTTINKLRDEQLWPQINELIHGLGRMWKVMLECHHSQCQVISEAKNMDAIASGGMLIDDAHKEATMQLQLELLNWLSSFYAWMSTQKAYIKALNEWLVKCLHYVPEETDDGIAPCSPGRIGAPPVFVICNHWSQAMERLSEDEVFTAMQTFSMSVLHLWEQYYEEQRKRMMANNDMEIMLKALESDDQKVRRAFDSVNKKLLMVSEQSGAPPPGKLVHHSSTADVSSLQLGLKQIFQAMDKFSAQSMEVYDELQKRREEQLATESAKIEGPRNRVADEGNPAIAEDNAKLETC